jgi:hypothetical protein
MRRRNLIFGLLAIATTGGARAEQSIKVHRIALVHPTHSVTALTDESPSPGIRALFNELRRLGYVEGKNLLVERFSGEGRATMSGFFAGSFDGSAACTALSSSTTGAAATINVLLMILPNSSPAIWPTALIGSPF